MKTFVRIKTLSLFDIPKLRQTKKKSAFNKERFRNLYIQRYQILAETQAFGKSCSVSGVSELRRLGALQVLPILTFIL